MLQDVNSGPVLQNLGTGSEGLMAKGIDCATPLTALTVNAVKEFGVEFVCRYLVPEKYSWKRLIRSEADLIIEAGMKIVSVFETSALRAKGGQTAGQEDGRTALKEALQLQQTKGSAIYFAVDFDAQQKDFAAIASYLKAAESELQDSFAVGLYGPYKVIEEMAKLSICRHFWQTYAWSNGKQSIHADIFQYQNGLTIGGLKLDLNNSFGNEGWWARGTVSLIGQVVDDDADVYLNNVYIGRAPIIKGASFFPTRAGGETLGFNVMWQPGRIDLITK